MSSEARQARPIQLARRIADGAPTGSARSPQPCAAIDASTIKTGTADVREFCGKIE
ncbi:hypothetical protein [Xanthomonas fragariae]|uniref:hypothetical protein n=1 Tax=Xanthomonas fragariae TaxID=48664 RepID=UPI001EDDE7F1|nr:hypothetical protein [Xanthomonas fragariae]UKR52896.1 hypothetical protein K4A87_02045 [Xanthomonas fragariae]